jgi:hypothetical protein
MQQLDVVLAMLTSFWTHVAAYIPQLIGGLILLLVGWTVARLARSGVVRLLKIVHFDVLAEKSGVEAFLKRGNLDISLTGALSNLVYWILILVVLVSVSNSLGLQMVADLFNKVVLYIPNVIVAILVLVFGSILARFANRVSFAYFNKIGVEGALTLSALCEYAVLIFVLFVALEQLQIGTQLLTAAFQVGFGAIGLALAISFGLGGREWAAGVIQRFTANKKRP